MSEQIYGAGSGPSDGRQFGTVYVMGAGGGGGQVHPIEAPPTFAQRVVGISIAVFVISAILWGIFSIANWLAAHDAERQRAAKVDCVARGGKVIENTGLARFSCDGPTKF